MSKKDKKQGGRKRKDVILRRAYLLLRDIYNDRYEWVSSIDIRRVMDQIELTGALLPGDTDEKEVES